MKKKGFQSHQWLILLTLMIGGFMGRLDGTIVNLALPKIITEFGITVSQASWITTAYIIANAIFIPIFGKLGDLMGMRKLNIYGIVGFTITSAFAGFAFNLPSMVFFRILQAIAISISYPIALSIIAYNFQDRQERAQAMGLYTAIFAAAAVFGPLLGGPLIDWFSWRSVFYVNIPIGIIATILSLRYIHDPPRKAEKHIKNFDIAGSLLLGICLGTLVLVLDQGRDWGWLSGSSILSYIISVVSFWYFLRVEKKQKEPIVDLKFFKNPTYTAAIVTSFISFMGMIGGIFLIPLFVQMYQGYSVTESGYLFMPMAFGMMVSAQLGARLAEKIEPRFLISFGMFLGAYVIYTFSGIDIKWTFFDFAFRLFIFAAGLGVGMASLTTAATSTVPLHEVGVASSVLALARNISGAFGTAIFATILSNSITSNLLSVQQHTIINTQDPAILKQVVPLMIVKGNILAYQTVFQTTVWFMVLGGIAALFVKESKRDFTSQPVQQHAHQAVEI